MAGPRNSTTSSSGSRTYKWRGEEFDSVTTIINGGVPKPALKAWGERTVAEIAYDQRNVWSGMDRDEAVDYLKRAPFRTTDKAAAQGKDIHAWAEAYVLGQPIPEPPLLQQPYRDSFMRFLDDWQPVYEMTEATVYNRARRYAGTLDFIARIEPLGLVLGDLKTGKGVYGEVALQLAAYRHAEFIGLPDGVETPMPAVDGCVVLHVTAKGYELIPVEADDNELRAFLYAQQVRHFCNVSSKSVLGAPLAPQRVAS
jgi:hypothetical protein